MTNLEKQEVREVVKDGMSFKQIRNLGGLETPDKTAPDKTAPAQLSQVVNYSEFLHELARQRHTVVAKYAGYPDHLLEVTEPLDRLIRDTLRHIAGNDLQLKDQETRNG